MAALTQLFTITWTVRGQSISSDTDGEYSGWGGGVEERSLGQERKKGAG